MQEYFKEVEEESIRDNFVICYELLDELVDFGYPQTTDAKILQEYITQVILRLRKPLETISSTYQNGLICRSVASYMLAVSNALSCYQFSDFFLHGFAFSMIEAL